MDYERALGWAESHLEGLEASINTFLREQDPYPLVSTHDEATDEVVVSLIVKRGIQRPDDWELRIGDVLHNMRVALDYLAFRIVTTQNPAANHRRIAFPIVETRENFAAVAGKCLPGISAEASQAIEAVQPFTADTGRGWNPLLELHALENVHKHRHLLDIGPAITSLGVVGWGGKAGLVRRVAGFGPLNDRAELFRYPRAAFKSEAEVQLRATTHICFDRNGPARGQIVLLGLRSIRDQLRDHVFPALAQFV